MVIAWEFPGYNSQRGVALSKRIGQLFYGLLNRNFNLEIIHKDHKNELKKSGYYIDKLNKDGKSFIRYIVDDKKVKEPVERANSIKRILNTYYDIYFNGDWTGRWADFAFENLKDKINKPDLIIVFFTPRGPIKLGWKLSIYHNVPYIVDFQDNFDLGLRKDQRLLSKYWMRRAIRKASFCTHVSPEWAERDAKYLKKEFITIRHAVPDIKYPINVTSKLTNKSFTIFFGGTIKIGQQSTETFIQGFLRVIEVNPRVLFKFAGNDSNDQYLRQFIPKSNYQFLGWLNRSSYAEQMLCSDCSLIFGWKNTMRMMIPSKLYEYMAYNKPILIAGADSGSIKILLDEWNHKMVINDSVDKVVNAIFEGIKGDYTNYLLPGKCSNVLTENKLVMEFENLMNERFLN